MLSQRKFGDWFFSGVYDPFSFSDVVDFLGELDDIMGRWDIPWCIGGDFNLVRFLLERKWNRRWDS